MKCIRCIAILLGLAICLGGILQPTGVMAAGDTSLEQTLADDLYTLGLFRGVGETDDGAINYDLTRVPNRAEALVMLVRLLGEEDAALSGNGKHPFHDVPDWADAYVGYAYEKGLVKGVSVTTFNANTPITASTYLTYVLRALGYQDASEGYYDDANLADFLWNQPEPLAAQCGLLPMSVNTDNFTRADAVQVSYAALLAHQKGNKVTLGEKLIQKDVFTQKKYEETIDHTVFADSQAVHQAIVNTVLDNGRKMYRETTSQYEGYQESLDYEAVSYYPLLYQREGTQVTAYLEADYVAYRYDSQQQPKNMAEIGAAYRIVLSKNEAGVYDVTSCWAGRYDKDGIQENLPPEACNKRNNIIYGSLIWAGLTQGVERRMLGEVTLPAIGTHDAVLSEFRSKDNYKIEEEIATSYGTIIIGWWEGGSHAPSWSLFFVPNAACTLGEGNYVTMPVNLISHFSEGKPETILLDDVGGTFTYSYSQMYERNNHGGILHTDKVYTYTLHLGTGEVTTSISDAPATGTT